MECALSHKRTSACLKMERNWSAMTQRWSASLHRRLRLTLSQTFSHTPWTRRSCLSLELSQHENFRTLHASHWPQFWLPSASATATATTSTATACFILFAVFNSLYVIYYLINHSFDFFSLFFRFCSAH